MSNKTVAAKTTDSKEDDGFISTIGDTFSTTVGTFLPIWAAQELQSRKQDQLADNLSLANSRLPNSGNTRVGIFGSGGNTGIVIFSVAAIAIVGLVFALNR